MKWHLRTLIRRLQNKVRAWFGSEVRMLENESYEFTAIRTPWPFDWESLRQKPPNGGYYLLEVSSVTGHHRPTLIHIRAIENWIVYAGERSCFSRTHGDLLCDNPCPPTHRITAALAVIGAKQIRTLPFGTPHTLPIY